MIIVLSFYKLKKIKKLKSIKNLFLKKINLLSIKGLVILSPEGINGTIAGQSKNINILKKIIIKYLNISKFDIQNTTKSNFIPFLKAKVKIKTEVVPINEKYNFDKKFKKKYLTPFQWNKFMDLKNSKIIDVRKPFEYEVGTFKKAINPNTYNFREFKNYLSTIQSDEQIGMFCTGGIRCEKATSFLKKKGYKNIYHLQGGILQYLKDVKGEKNLFEGECFVFDKRVALDHELKKGSYSICHACGMPVSIQDQKRKEYRKGIQCHFCIDQFSDDDRKRFEERQKQIDRLKVENHKIYKD